MIYSLSTATGCRDGVLDIAFLLTVSQRNHPRSSGGISLGAGDDGPLGSTLRVCFGLLRGVEDTSRLHLGKLSFLEDGGDLPVDDSLPFSACAVDLP